MSILITEKNEPETGQKATLVELGFNYTTLKGSKPNKALN